jgi:HEAT repeat protein
MKYFWFALIFFYALSVSGQQKNIQEDFNKDFIKALNKKFSESDLNKMFKDYSMLLTPHSDVTRFAQQLQGNAISIFPLTHFKSQKLYINNITTLLNSPNPNQRILAYLVIASSGDITKERILLNKLKAETKKGNLIWAGMALLYLNCNHTTSLFDFLVKNEDFGDAHMLPLFIQLNKDSLQYTAYNRINSTNVKARILAAQILSVTPLNEKTEDLLMQAVRTWDIKLKGYAIYSVKQLQIGNLLETFKPLLDSPQTRSIALKALANSPTKADRQYLLELVNKHDTIPEPLLTCLYESKNEENIKYWLKLLYTKNLPKDYTYFVFTQPLISSDDILPDLQIALNKVKNPEVLGELVRALEGRTDDISIDIMIGFLQHPNSTVKYWTAKSLEHNSSIKIKNPKIKELIIKGLAAGND